MAGTRCEFHLNSMPTVILRYSRMTGGASSRQRREGGYRTLSFVLIPTPSVTNFSDCTFFAVSGST